ncbi:MAG: proton-conducting membrane transporter, partial [Paraburkholderia sp.]|nr:proton-conducting membrane transporter [Paraburkholderia sp.]
KPGPTVVSLCPVYAVAFLLFATGYVAASASGAGAAWIFLPLVAGGLFYLGDRLPGRVKGLLMLLAVALVGAWLARGTSGIAALFAWLLLAGSLIIASASLYRNDVRRGFYPMLVILLLSMPALLRSTTSLEFFYSWEIVTLSSCFLIATGRDARSQVLGFLLFSLLSAFFLLAGFAAIAAIDGTTELATCERLGAQANQAFVLLATGFLIKAGAVGAHVWLPGAYTHAEDDVTDLLSAVVSKVAMFGLLFSTYLTIRSGLGLELAHVMAWIGTVTTLAGALMALRQYDFKRLLAYSSMSQLGYIVTAISLMNHLGWVGALYLVANHMLVKGILFLALAGVIVRTGLRSFAGDGGLARSMPVTFATVLIAIFSMSGLPPLMGFGGKWLLLGAILAKGWYGLAIFALFATFAGFLYMIRFVSGIFFGVRPAGRARVAEAPLILLVPQCALVAGIIVLSFFPKILMEPVSAAIDPQFASTLVWGGMSLESIYGFWNPLPIVTVIMLVAAFLFTVFVLVYLNRRGHGEGVYGFFKFYRPVLGRLMPPVATSFWRGVSHGTLAAAGLARRIYTGNAQTYAFYVLCYFLALHIASTGLSGLWPGG